METPAPKAENKPEFVDYGFEVTVVGLSGEELVVKVQKDFPIQLIQMAMQTELGIPRDQQRLIFDGKEVVGSWKSVGEAASRQSTLEDHGIQKGSTLQLVVNAKHSEARCYGQSEVSDCALG
jgi:hypothetical protein